MDEIVMIVYAFHRDHFNRWICNEFGLKFWRLCEIVFEPLSTVIYQQTQRAEAATHKEIHAHPPCVTLKISSASLRMGRFMGVSIQFRRRELGRMMITSGKVPRPAPLGPWLSRRFFMPMPGGLCDNCCKHGALEAE